MSNVIEFIPSQRGGKILIFENNMYKIKRTNKKNNTTVWYCTSGNKHGCRAKVFLNGDTFFSNSGKHNHESQEKQILNRKFMENMKDRARKDITVSVKRIYDESIAEMVFSAETPLTIPVYDSIHKTLYKARHSTTRPPAPKTVDEINLIKERKKTKNGQELILKEDVYGEDKLLKKGGKNSLSVQKNDDLNLSAFENEEVITPDVAMQYSENTDMETQNDEDTNLLSNSDIVIKPEIIEMELEPNVFDDSSFDSSFTDCPSETHFHGLRPSTSYEKHSESLSSDTDTLPGSEKNGALNEDQENSKRDNSFQPRVHPSLINITDSESSLRNEQMQLGGSSPSLHQGLNSTSHERLCNLLKVPSHSSTPFRPRDRFDAFGDFITLKLRNLDPKLSVFVQTSIADLIFKAELGIFSNKNEKSSTVTQTDDIGKDTPPVNTFENTHRSSEKENIQPKIPSHMENTHLPTDFNTTGHASSSRNETFQHRIPYTTNTSFPPLVNNTDSENSLRNDSTATCHIENPLPPVSNVTITENASKNNANQTSVSSDSIGSSVSPVLNTVNSLSDTPIQPIVPFHTRVRDEFDIYGEFAASKLRNLDLRLCAYVKSAFANLIFKAELGKFVNENEHSYFVNKTNDIFRNIISTSDLSLQKNVVSNLTSYETQPQFNFTPLDFCADQVPSEVKPNLRSVHK